MPQRFPLPIRFSIPIILITCGGFFGLISFRQEIIETSHTETTNAKNYLKIYAGQTARILDYMERKNSIEGGNVNDIETTIISQIGSDPNLSIVVEIDDQNIIHLSSNYELKGTSITQTINSDYRAYFASVKEKMAGKILISQDQKKLIAIYPLVLQILPNEIKPSRVGILLLEYDLTSVQKESFNAALRRSLIFNGVLIIFCLGLWFFFYLTFTKRVYRLVSASNSLAEGKLDIRTKLTGSDELMQVSVAFDRMAVKIQENANALQYQAERERLLREITQRVRQSLDLETIFNTATEETRKFLDVDRVCIFKFAPESDDNQGEFVSESVKIGVNSILNIKIEENCFKEQDKFPDPQNQIPINDIYQVKKSDCYSRFLEQFKIQANLLIPLVVNGKFWGLFCIHQCYEPRKWQQLEIDYVQQIANQLSIAIQQTDLFKQINKELTEKQKAEAKLTESNQQLEISNQQLAQATRLKNEFLANMSHELRTPLNAILGMSEALQEEIFGGINDKQQQAIETIATSGTHLLSLINDILDIAKIESGKFEIECAPTSIKHLCESSLLFIKQQSLQKRITIQTKIPPNLPEIIVDERRIRQVLINLLDNAIKFTPAGGKITFDVTIENSSSIGFAVTDTGIGITPENLTKLFQPFIQIDSALNRQYAGTGLGLTLVKRIVEMHGGEVKVESTIDLGSCFAFRLPCQDLLLPTPQSPSETGLNLDPSSTNQALQELSVILLAEDHEANIITISRYLKAKGYQIILAKNGQEAIDQAKLYKPDLILMDIQMPVMDGLEAIQRIREDSDRKLANIPIIALTALAMTSDKQKCLEAGANDYLTKPVKLSQLTSTIQQILAQGKN
ncbi:Two-component hybrid sensor and regulator (modular protein) [Planktothrix agardhii]|uniref:response regulator n=1 Tax=Planktothrix agardhii TaxID=1160 RepID=UPI001B9612F7|nr:response regulator [Planktothrix agardhii]CAD0227923.1 Two-component hybrid sensor and regulator (modular protein) [Planktothrix agardhii]